MDKGSDRDAALVAGTLAAALEEATARWGDVDDLLAGLPAAEPHPMAPEPGASATSVFEVGEEDTAVAMGHPDPTMRVLGSPRIGLWFEWSASPLMPPPGPGARHVGVGLVVHHLRAAFIGETVSVETRVLDVRGRAVTFASTATVGERLVATGVHHRLILSRHGLETE